MTTSVLIDGHEFLLSITSAQVMSGGITTRRPGHLVPGGPDDSTGRPSPRATPRVVGALIRPGG